MKQIKISAKQAEKAVRALDSAPRIDIEDVFTEVEYPPGSGESRVALNAGKAEVPVLVRELESMGLVVHDPVEVGRAEFGDTVWVILNALPGKDL